MKTSEELLDEIMGQGDVLYMDRGSAVMLIEQFKKEAYNEALEDIAKLPITTYVAYEPHYDCERSQSILTLLKP
jgi:hypothetical protein